MVLYALLYELYLVYTLKMACVKLTYFNLYPLEAHGISSFDYRLEALLSFLVQTLVGRGTPIHATITGGKLRHVDSATEMKYTSTAWCASATFS